MYILTTILIIKALKIANSLTPKHVIFLTGFLIRIYDLVLRELVSRYKQLPGSFGFRQTLLIEGYIFILTATRLLYHINIVDVARGFSTLLEASARGLYFFSKYYVICSITILFTHLSSLL